MICGMTTEVLRRPATYEDLLSAPEHMVAEIVDGELYTSPRPASRHARAAGALFSQLARQFDGDGEPGGWWIVFETELHLGVDVLVPDIAGWRRERMPVFPDVAFFDLVPDWICEVLSKSNAAHDKFRKMPRYARHEVEYAWIVDTVAKGVEVYQRQSAPWLQVAMHQGAGVIRAVPFDAGEVNLATLWID
jgi:Uma2 family endonuclease